MEKLANSAMLDTNYNIMIQHLETGDNIQKIPKEYELQELASYFQKLSVFDLKGGQSIILKNGNCDNPTQLPTQFNPIQSQVGVTW